MSQGGSFNAQRTLITNRINQLGSQPMMAVPLSAGLDLAVQHVTGPEARAFSNKVVILLTDGEWNDGRHPLLAAEDARNAGVTVHTVTMLTQYQPIVEQVAHTTGGLAYTTNNEAQLRAAFREIARSLQIVMIE